MRSDETKTPAGRRTIALSRFAIDALVARRTVPYFGEHPVIMFPSTAAQLLQVGGDADRRQRLSARIGADHLGHARPSMTQDVTIVTRQNSHAGGRRTR
jgi:integrase